MIRYTVLSVEPILSDYRPSARMKRVAADKDEVPKGRQAVAASSKLAECTIARERDFGMNDIQFTVMSHLGPILSVGDVVLGYDLTSTNFNIDEDGEKLLSTLPEMPDVIIVRKVSVVFLFSSLSLRSFVLIIVFTNIIHSATTRKDCLN